MNSSATPIYKLNIFKHIQLWAYNYKLKEILNCSRKIIALAEMVLIEDFESSLPKSDNSERAKLAYHIIREFFNASTSEDTSEFFQDNKEFIELKIESIRGIQILEKRKNDYFKLMKYYWGDSVNNIPDKYNYRKILLSDDIVAFTEKEYRILRRNTETEFKTVKQEFLKKLKAQREEEKLEKIKKIELSTPGISTFIAVFSSLFVCTGFIYNYIYLGYFGIEISKFYVLSDYLSTSIDKIFYSLISVVVTLIIGLFLYPDYLYGELPQRPKSKWGSKLDNFLFKAAIPTSILMTILAYHQGNPSNFYSMLRMTLLFLSIILIVKIIKVFSNPIKAYFVFFSMAIFLLNIAFGSIEDINNIISKKKTEQSKYVFTLINGYDNDLDGKILLASNSNYLFFYNNVDKSIEAIKVSDVERVKMAGDENRSAFYKYIVDRFIYKEIYPTTK